MQGMSQEETERLNEALKVVMGSSMEQLTSAEARDPNARTQRARASVDGKTAQDVLDEAERIKAARAAAGGEASSE